MQGIQSGVIAFRGTDRFFALLWFVEMNAVLCDPCIRLNKSIKEKLNIFSCVP